MEQPTFWDDQDKARQCIEHLNALKVWLDPCDALQNRLEEILQLVDELEDQINLFTKEERMAEIFRDYFINVS